jgi:hypothetical protein
MKARAQDVTVAFRCDEVLDDLIERQAAAEGLSKSAVARRCAIREFQRLGLYPSPATTEAAA